MKTHFLFPNKCKKFGWILFVPSLLLGSILFISGIDFGNYFKMNVFAIYSDQFLSGTNFFTLIENGVLDEIIIVLIIVGAVLISFSKTKNEDEFISKIRYESLVWATYLNFILMIIATLVIYGFAYFNVLLANVFAMLLFFIIRFHFMIYKLNKSSNDEE
jgi:phosphatidylglycerophosphate synthase